MMHTLESYCTKCDIGLDEFDVKVKVLPSSAKFLKIGPVRESFWYHSTRTEGWDEKHHKFTDPIYLGTRNSAMRRFNDLRTMTPQPNSLGWLYKVKLKPGVKIHRSVLKDDHLDHTTAEYEDRLVRYVNVFESIGSISLITHPGDFQIIDCKELT